MRLKNQKGAAAVEFAVILPLLLVMVFGIIEFSVYFYDKAMITNASREGARAGIVFAVPTRVSNTIIVNTVTAYCADNLISFDPGATLSINIDPLAVADRSTAGVPLTVTVNYPFRFLVFSNLLGVLGGNIADVLTLEAVTIMRME
jgi:Flp pilus assembly protein TadG